MAGKSRSAGSDSELSELSKPTPSKQSRQSLELATEVAEKQQVVEGDSKGTEKTEEIVEKQIEKSDTDSPGSSKLDSDKSGEDLSKDSIQSELSKVSAQEDSENKDNLPENTVQMHTSLMGEHAMYQDLSLIGNGAYGTVYKAKDQSSGHIVALKKVRIPLTEDGLPSSTLREIATLKQLERFEHPNIVRLLDVCQGSRLHIPNAEGRTERVDRGLTLWLVFEHVEQDLAAYMSSCPTPGMSTDIVRAMSRQILQGVEFLHSHRIIHRDLKPQNLLVSKEGVIKIADFGLAKTYDFEMRLTSVVVTLWYRAPEVLLGCTYATPVDIWSVGCIIAELFSLDPLFPGTSEGDQLDRIFTIIGTPAQDQWPQNVSLSWTAFSFRPPTLLKTVIPRANEHGIDLIQNMLLFNPLERLSASRALNHRFFTHIEL